MGFLGLGLVFIGYVLCYASVAAHGKFAVTPWAGITESAYDG